MCYIIYCIVNDGISYILKEDNSVLLASFNVVEFSLFCLFYYTIVSPGIMKKAVLPIMGLFFVFACISFFFIHQKSPFDSIPVGVESILIILMCIYYFVVQLKQSTDFSVYSTSNFWIIITFLIYLSGSFFLYIMAGTMYHDKAFQKQYDIINSVFYIIKNILLSIAMLMKTTAAIKKPQENNDWDEGLLSYKSKK
ncbi:MAG: hypothetical protein ABI863_20525 [Ginsengibacter sp.]